NVWRERATVPCEPIIPGVEDPPDFNWRDVLVAGDKHDPDNALYELLFAKQLLVEASFERMAAANPSAGIVQPENLSSQELTEDAIKRETEGLEHLKAALLISKLEGPDDRRCVLAFLEKTKLRSWEQAGVAWQSTSDSLDWAMSLFDSDLKDLARQREFAGDL